jgi:formylglycine-generating enzyme required for sulfatase activity
MVRCVQTLRGRCGGSWIVPSTRCISTLRNPAHLVRKTDWTGLRLVCNARRAEC